MCVDDAVQRHPFGNLDVESALDECHDVHSLDAIENTLRIWSDHLTS
ncbi:hypothetical protein P9209_19180 [Prescottella defluvii]|nr:hypothetical protein P9209_19180 [Prescottella defluvii]